jgi:hypothetical protein
MEEEDLTQDTQPKLDGAEAVGNEGVAELSLKELNETLGKDFPTKEAALKSIKDTVSYTGKRKEDIIAEYKKQAGDSELASKVSTLENMLLEANFYAENPQYKPYKDVITKFGGNPAEVIKDPVFQSTFKKASAFDETEKSKSVLHSNPRLGRITDKITEAKTALSDGDSQKANDAAVEAVLSAFEK